MLFNSYDFLLGFLPLVLVGHRAVRRWGGVRASWIFLVLASLVFYAWWYPPYLALLLSSVAGNYLLGRVAGDPNRQERTRRGAMTVGVTANLAALGFFKYAGFLDENAQALFGIDLGLPRWALPLAISFFTFQQIAYLVDTFRGKTRNHGLLEYVFFVTFFPQLVAGPIVHHAEVIPQVREGRKIVMSDVSVGLTMFVLGLAKKVLIADSLAPHADMVFGGVAMGMEVPVLAAWSGLLCFFFQVYFDFSGYSDMAVGLARLFGIVLPINFDAPYRSNNMIEWWARWHVTLSRFLRDYLYIPLGGNRKGPRRRYVNLFLTMALGGLWHGAAWTYVAWGSINGFYLVINNVWRGWRGGPTTGRWATVFFRALTLLAGMWSNIYFRAHSMADAWVMQKAMLGFTPAGLGAVPEHIAWLLLGTFALTQLAPTSHMWLERWQPVLTRAVDQLRWPRRLMWKPTPVFAVVVGVIAVACVPFLERAQQFIYWQF